MWSTNSDIGAITSDFRLALKLVSELNLIDTIEILFPPNHFFPSLFNPQQDEMFSLGGSLDFRQRYFAISTHDWSQSDLSKGNKKKLRQFRERGGYTTQLSPSNLPSVYAVIKENRRMLGVSPSIDLEGLTRLFEKFPEHYRLFGSFIGDDLTAVAVTVETSKKQHYVFFWADVLQFRPVSPVVSLCDFLVDYSRNNGYDILDLGAASTSGVDTEGLLRFKQNLGATEYEQLQILLRL